MKNVLITPLDWGLGHATRCIPIINELLRRNCKVMIGGSGESLALLKEEFPSLKFIELPGYRPAYPLSGKMVWSMLTQLPKFLSTIKEEHQVIEDAVKGFHIDLVISDNRYGCWSSVVPSVFITHQLNILLPKRFKWLARYVEKFNHSLIKKFKVCWIPDFPDGRSLAGKLPSLGTNEHSLNVKYIGVLSRFTQASVSEIVYDVLCILSGPEPQRTEFERIAVLELARSGLRYYIVRGIVGGNHDAPTTFNGVNFLKASELLNLIGQSECVLARSGYSTIMDMSKLGKKVIFVPTPGQTEQEYLAARLRAKELRIPQHRTILIFRKQ
jgi:UDP:flavonoid glycosyltransferase YjiC (YdhE family)